MPIKGLFNINHKREDPVRSEDEWDKQTMRINSLEVQIKKLLEFEKQVRLSMYGKKEDFRHNNEKIPPKPATSREMSSPEDSSGRNESLKWNELARRMDKLESIVQSLSSRLQDTINRSLKQEKNNMERKEEEVLFSLIDRRVAALEHNYTAINEIQAGLINQMDELMEKQNDLLEKRGESEGSALSEVLPYKTLYIDKVYLGKYEQNNNIAQIGIHELGGALNIGATYGKDVIPSSITEEAKEEIEKMKAAFDQGEEQPETNEPDKPQPESSSSEFTPIFLEEDEFQ